MEYEKKYKEALDVFMVNQKNGNAMLEKIYEEQQCDDAVASADALEEERKSQENFVKDF